MVTQSVSVVDLVSYDTQTRTKTQTYSYSLVFIYFRSFESAAPDDDATGRGSSETFQTVNINN